MDSLIIEALPTATDRPLAVAIEIRFPVIGEDVVLAGHEEIAPGLRFPQDLIARVEFGLFRQMRQVARVQQQGGRVPQRINSRDRFAQCAGHILVRSFGKADVAVADLDERKAAGRGGVRVLSEYARDGNAAAQAPQQARADPRHAFEHSPPIDSISLVIVILKVDFALHRFIPLLKA